MPFNPQRNYYYYYYVIIIIFNSGSKQYENEMET